MGGWNRARGPGFVVESLIAIDWLVVGLRWDSSTVVLPEPARASSNDLPRRRLARAAPWRLRRHDIPEIIIPLLFVLTDLKRRQIDILVDLVQRKHTIELR